MSQEYKLRFDQMKQNNPALADADLQNNEGGFYPDEGSIRNLCLVFLNGDRKAMPYAYISDYDFKIGEKKNSIILELSTQIITLSGFGLFTLYGAILQQFPRYVYQRDERYAGQEETIVTDIVIEKKSQG